MDSTNKPKTLDYFSSVSKKYSEFRPKYPKELYDFICSHVQENKLAWDCATGNGQAAVALTDYFEKVIGTDISLEQINHATKHEKIQYFFTENYKTPIMDDSVSLVTVATAFHWFDFEAFYSELRRVVKKDGILAVWTYANRNVLQKEVQKILLDLREFLGPYRPPQLKYIYNAYKDIPFPFEEIPAPKMMMSYEVDLEKLLGHISTVSGFNQYVQKTGKDPLDSFLPELKEKWGDPKSKLKVEYDLFLRVGRVKR